MADPRDDDWFVCPTCGEVLVGDPSACPRCGADDEAGWTGSDADILPEEFDYDEFLGADPALAAPRRRPTWIVIGLLAALAAAAVLAGIL